MSAEHPAHDVATRLSPHQMKLVADHLTAHGFTVEIADSGEWGDASEWTTVDWGDWHIDQDGDLNTYDDHWPIGDCDIVAFVREAHVAWHTAVTAGTMQDDV